MSPNETSEQLQQDSTLLNQSALEERLQMTPEERIEAHENARQLMDDLRKAGGLGRAESERLESYLFAN
jgi:hypothetical protein